MKQYQFVALGGTFDHFHKGHKHFLSYAFSLSSKVVIGITSEQLARQKAFPEALQSFLDRKYQLNQFLQNHHFQNRAQIVTLIDKYGPTLKDKAIEALVVTQVTLPGAQQVNQKRQALGLSKLPIHVCPMIKSNDRRYLSSTRIRQGLISRSGDVYAHFFEKNYHVSEKLRFLLQQPQGKLIKQNIVKKIKNIVKNNKPFKIALVGDFITNFFIEKSLPFNYATVDFKVQRQTYPQLIRAKISTTARNPAGQITASVSQKIFKLTKKRSLGLIRILGEEDLTVIPFILSLPLTSLVIYGQPGNGCVVVAVDENAKKKFVNYLKS